jgi:hypothetical protein
VYTNPIFEAAKATYRRDTITTDDKIRMPVTIRNIGWRDPLSAVMNAIA